MNPHYRIVIRTGGPRLVGLTLDARGVNSVKTVHGGRRRLVFVSPRLPGRVGGDRLTTWQQVKMLAKHFDVHFIGLTETRPEPYQTEFLANHTASTTIFLKGRFASGFAALWGFLRGLPLQVGYYTFPDVRRHVTAMVESSDLIFCRMVRAGEYRTRAAVPAILDMQDLYSEMYARGAAQTRSRRWSLVYGLEARRLAMYERRIVKRFDRVLLFSEAERAMLPDSWTNVVQMPHGVIDGLLKYDRKCSGYDDALVFFGKMDYQPNVDAVLWFAEHVLPTCRGMRLVVVGANPSRKILGLANSESRVEVLGFVPDPYEILRSAAVVIVPMQTGGGVQNKLLEAMAVGALVVASPLAVRAFTKLQHGEAVVVARSPSEYVDWIRKAQSEPEWAARIRENAREFVRAHHTWESYESKLLKVLEDIR